MILVLIINNLLKHSGLRYCLHTFLITLYIQKGTQFLTWSIRSLLDQYFLFLFAFFIYLETSSNFEFEACAFCQVWQKISMSQTCSRLVITKQKRMSEGVHLFSENHINWMFGLLGLKCVQVNTTPLKSARAKDPVYQFLSATRQADHWHLKLTQGWFNNMGSICKKISWHTYVNLNLCNSFITISRFKKKKKDKQKNKQKYSE